MSEELSLLRKRLADIDRAIRAEADSEPMDASHIIGLEYRRCGVIDAIYQIENPGFCLDDNGQPIPKALASGNEVGP